MIVVKKNEQVFEKQWLTEMAINVVSSSGELPFKVAIKSPDHLPPHAHVMDETGRKEIGQFLIPVKQPYKVNDVKDYKQGVTDEMRQAIFEWLRNSYRDDPEITNWRALSIVWKPNER
jgi:hypothetical protein